MILEQLAYCTCRKSSRLDLRRRLNDDEVISLVESSEMFYIRSKPINNFQSLVASSQSFALMDYKSDLPESCQKAALQGLRSGAILLCHDILTPD